MWFGSWPTAKGRFRYIQFGLWSWWAGDKKYQRFVRFETYGVKFPAIQIGFRA